MWLAFKREWGNFLIVEASTGDEKCFVKEKVATKKARGVGEVFIR